MFELALDKCQTFIETQFRPARPAGEKPPGERPLVTISRETGAGGTALAAALADHLNERAPRRAVPWTVFDKNLLEKVLAEHDLPERIAELIPEDRHSAVADAVEELLGLHPSAWRIVQQTIETIRHLAEVGNVILVGRGSHVITARMPGALHVRVVAPEAWRVQKIQADLSLTRKKAQDFVREGDAARARYIKRYFKRDITDPLDYHLMINTALLPTERAVKVIAAHLLG